MTLPRLGVAAFVVLSVLSSPSLAQVAFQPTVSAFPNGVTLSATPVVSADRRYVRLGMNPQFTGLEGFESYAVPAAVSGGGLRSVDVPGLAYGMDGPVGSGPYGYGYGPGYLPPTSASAAAFLAGGAGYPDRQRLVPFAAEVPRQKAVRKTVRTKKARGSR
jgi:hypothetical protein